MNVRKRVYEETVSDLRLPSLRARLVEVVKERGHRILDHPVQLASGDWSRHFVDGKRALARGSDLRLAAEAIVELLDEEGVTFDAIGGLTLGADQFAHAVALLEGDVEWFTVRKAAKDRGTRQRIEGALLGPGRRVVLVDDVVTRGGSILDALGAIRQTGATVVFAVALVDRGDDGSRIFDDEEVAYRSLVRYSDLGIPPVGDEPGIASATG